MQTRHQARLAKCKETNKEAHDFADMEFELAKKKCANKRKEDLAQCAFAYAEAIENCDSARDDKKRKADEQLLVDLSNCHPSDEDCFKAAHDKHTQALANAKSEHTKCVENAESAKTKCDGNAKAARTRCVKDAKDERDTKKARADYVYKKCEKLSKRMLEACLNPGDSSGDSSGDGSY